MTDNEMLQAMKDLLTPINLQLEKMENEMSNMKYEMSSMKHEMSIKLEKMDNRLTNLEYEVRKGFRKNNDEIQTLVAVLEAKGILPIAK